MTDLAPEDAARADFYALLARLWHSGPDAALLAAIAAADEIVAEGGEAKLADAWRQLRGAAGATDAEAAWDEHESLFIGAGKAAVTPYASPYLAETARERVLVAAGRPDGFGLERNQASRARGSLRRAVRSDAASCRRGLFRCCTAATEEVLRALYARAYNPLTDEVLPTKTRFYGYVARFTKAFCDTEAASLDML